VAPTSDVNELRLQLSLILLLGLGNFFLQAYLLKRRAIPAWLTYAATAADLTVITVLLLSQGGDSPMYVLYFPALLALSVAFAPAFTVLFAASTMFAYAAVAGGHVPDAILATRQLMLAGTAFCGGVYWYVERDRRRRLRHASATPEGSLS